MFDLHENIQGQSPPRVEISLFLIQYQCLTYWEKLDIAAGISPLIARHFYILGLQKTEGVKSISLTSMKIFKVKVRPRLKFRNLCIMYQCLTYW